MATSVCLCGCQTYHYRIVQPQTTPAIVAQQGASLKVDPLEYRLEPQNGRLEIRVVNPTLDRIVMLGERSYVTDPKGESHPIRGRVLGPHSFVRLLLPPIPFTYAHPDYTWGWGWGGWAWGWGWPAYVPMTGPYYTEGFFGPPPLVYEQALTIYDWDWKRGPIHLRLTYERGKDTFEHQFEFDREPDK